MSAVGGFVDERAELATLSDAALEEALVEHLRAAVAEAAGRRPEHVRLDWVDPNPAVLWSAVQSYVLRHFGFPLLAFDLPHCHSISELAAHLARELRLPPAPEASVSDLYRPGWAPAAPPERRSGPRLERPILFLLSPPRSGSTLLCAMLARHPRLFGTSELFLLPFETMGARRRWLGAAGAAFRIGLSAALRDLTGVTQERGEQTCLDLEAEDVAVSDVYRRLQELAGDRMIVDKSVAYASDPLALGAAEHHFEAARYIHLTRHPGAVIESFVRMRFHRLLGNIHPAWDENPWLFAEKVWTSNHLHCLRFLDTVDANRQLRISYESLVTDPAAAVARMCDFLQIPFDAAPLQPYGVQGLQGGGRLGDPRFFSHSAIEARLASDWRSHRPPQSLGRITREVAETLGYSLE